MDTAPIDTRRHRRSDTGGIVFGVILLLVGGYYLLERTFGLALPELDWDKLWPIFLIGLGLAIAWGAWRRREA